MSTTERLNPRLSDKARATTRLERVLPFVADATEAASLAPRPGDTAADVADKLQGASAAAIEKANQQTDAGGTWGINSGSLYCVGDSIVAGSSASSAAVRFTSIVSAALGRPQVNLAFGGATATDLCFQILPGYTHTNDYGGTYTSPASTPTAGHWLLKVGVNDAGDFPASSGNHSAFLNHYYHAWLHAAAYCATPSKTLAAAMTKGGTWTAYTDGPTAGFGGAVALKATTPGATLTFECHGTAAYVAYLVSKNGTTTGGTFTVAVDGVTIETVDTAGQGFGNRNDYSGPFAYIPYTATDSVHANRYANLGSRRHTVTITTVTCSAGQPVVIVWGAGSQQPIGQNSGPFVWCMENVNRAADATRDTTYANLRAKVSQAVQEVGGDIGNVALVPTNAVYNTATGMSGDNIHPNTVGHSQIAAAILGTMARNQGRPLPASSSSGGSVSLSAPVTVASPTAGVAAFVAELSGSGFGFLATGNGFGFITRNYGTGAAARYFFNVARGTSSAPSAVQNGDNLGELRWAPHDDAGFDSGAYFGAFATQTHTATAHGTELRAYTVPAGSTTATLALTIKADGSMTVAAGATFAGAVTIDTTANALTLNGDAQFGLLLHRNNASASKEIGFQRQVSGGAVTSGQVVGRIRAYPHNGTTYPGARAEMRFEATETHTGSVQGTQTVWTATPTGSTTPADKFAVDGNDNSTTQTAMLVAFNGTLRRVQVGAADSGGTGFRLLRITN